MATDQRVNLKDASKASSPEAGLKVFRGDFLWVNHDAGHMKAAPNRHKVFTHIQKRYRPWKRRSSPKSQELVTTVSLTSTSDGNDNEYSQVERSPTPSSLVASGNSDPFSALPITIGPEENELISFYRDYILPAQYGNTQMQVKKLWQKDWQDCMDGMLDEGIAHGSLARWGYMITPHSPRLHAMTIQHQLKATQAMRRKLAKGENLQTYRNYMHLNMLYSAETISRNVTGARIHGHMFKKLFEEAWRRGTLNVTLLIYQLHNDVQTSAISLLPTVFDLEVFVPLAIQSLRQSCIMELPAVGTGSISPALSPTIMEPLLGFFKSLRSFWAMLDALSRQLDGTVPINMATMRSFEDCLHVGRAVNHYVHFRDRLDWESKRSKKVILLAQVFLSLGALYLAKSFNLDHRTLGRPLFDMRPVVLPALRNSLQQFADLATVVEHEHFARARIWALYVGALSEHRWPSKVDPRRWYFTVQLAREAQDSDLTSWSKLLPVLQTFVFSDQIGPSGEDWFDQVITRWNKMNTDGS